MPNRKRLYLERSLVEDYCSRMSDADAAADLGIAMVTFYLRRKELGIRSFFQRTGLRKRKDGEVYRFLGYDEDFFEVIDTKEKAYFLGLLASDGNISPRLTAVRIALKACDQDILENFRECLGPNAPLLREKVSTIKGKKNIPQKVLALSRIKMVQDLIAHGVTPAKSHTLKIKTCFRPEDISHFLRGVWDGDGSVTERRFKVTTGSPCFADQLQGWIQAVSGVKLAIYKEKTATCSNLYSLAGYIRDAAAIRAIYGQEGPALKRKHDAFVRYWGSRR